MISLLRVGVIGVGAMGENHVRRYKQMKVELVGVADPNSERLNEIKTKYEVAGFSDYKELLKQELDAVSIVVPTMLHKQVTLDCFAMGANVLVEKPIADSVKNADEMIKKAEKDGLRMTVGHIERFNPMISKLKDVISEGNLGKIVTIQSIRVGPHNPRIRDVGIITDLGIHDIDVMNFLYEKMPISVSTCAGIVCHPHADYASIQTRYSHEQSGSIETNWLTPLKIRKLTVIATQGVAFGDYMKRELEFYCDGNTKRYSDTEEPLARELKHFIGCLKSGKEFLVRPEEARDALKVVEAAEKSYLERREVPVK
ncbi:MAG: Gfo/Idh/MocA family oxidoreductase [Candidatus Methanofastidiosia archaeon]